MNLFAVSTFQLYAICPKKSSQNLRNNMFFWSIFLVWVVSFSLPHLYCNLTLFKNPSLKFHFTLLQSNFTNCLLRCVLHRHNNLTNVLKIFITQKKTPINAMRINNQPFSFIKTWFVLIEIKYDMKKILLGLFYVDVIFEVSFPTSRHFQIIFCQSLKKEVIHFIFQYIFEESFQRLDQKRYICW